MTRYILISLLLLLSVMATAQNSVEQLFSKYDEDSSFRIVNVTSVMFNLLSTSEKVEANPDLAKLVKDLTSMKVLSKEADAKTLYSEALPAIRKDFEHIMTIKEDGEDVEMFIRQGDKHVEQFVAVARKQDTFVLIDLQGVIDLQTIGKLGETLDAPGLDYLNRIKR